MAAKYDLESFTSDIETLLKANLNTKIAAIDTEKADGITTGPVNDAAYFFQSLNEDVVNLDPFIFWGVDNIVSDSLGPATLETVSVAIMLVMEDTAEDGNLRKRMLRYKRALQEVFQDNWDKTSNRVKIKVQTFPPTQFKDEVNSSNEAKAVMVIVTGRIASV